MVDNTKISLARTWRVIVIVVTITHRSLKGYLLGMKRSMMVEKKGVII